MPLNMSPHRAKPDDIFWLRLYAPELRKYSSESLRSEFPEKRLKFSRHFKGHLQIGKMSVRILPGQPGSPRFREFPSLDEKGPLNAGFSHR